MYYNDKANVVCAYVSDVLLLYTCKKYCLVDSYITNGLIVLKIINEHIIFFSVTVNTALNLNEHLILFSVNTALKNT